MNERDAMMRSLCALGFSLYDLQLYLDTHPHDTNALSLYGRYRQQYMQQAAAFEQKYGPLTAMNGASGDTWKWVRDPWPWEYAASMEGN